MSSLGLKNRLLGGDTASGKAHMDAADTLPLNKLVPFKDHPFRSYNDELLRDMADSIKDNGVLLPIIVRPAPDDDTKHEILSGHNRVKAAKIAELDSIPVIIREGLTDEEARIIVTETNLLQRSVADLSHSELAAIIAVRHDAVKHQGKRVDLIHEIENMVSSDYDGDCETSSTTCQKYDSRSEVGIRFNMKSRTIAKYLRINKLIAQLKEQLDDQRIGFDAAVTISYIPEPEQLVIADVLDSSRYKLDVDKAQAMRQASKLKPLDCKEVDLILSGARNPKSIRPPSFKLKHKILDKYFVSGEKPGEIESVIDQALELWFSNKQ